jgi:hypothetical protein
MLGCCKQVPAVGTVHRVPWGRPTANKNFEIATRLGSRFFATLGRAAEGKQARKQQASTQASKQATFALCGLQSTGGSGPSLPALRLLDRPRQPAHCRLDSGWQLAFRLDLVSQTRMNAQCHFEVVPRFAVLWCALWLVEAAAW